MARTNLGKIVMIPKGTYSTTVTYSKLDVVTSNGSGYISKSDNNLNKPLTNETYWMKLVEKGDKGDKGDSYIITEADIQEIEDYVVDKTSGQIVSTRNELERVKNDILETGEDTDTFIHVEDSAMAELQELEVDGVCEQNTTTGKNLLPNNATSQSINGVTYTVNLDGSIYAKGTATARSEFYIYNKPFTLNANTEYKIQSNVLMILSTTTGYISGTTGAKFTSESEISVFSVCIRVENGTSIDKTIYPMITLVEANDTYEPYTGGQPSPSPDYQQNISVLTGNIKLTSCNKNLFDKDNITPDNFFNTSNGYFYAMELGNEFKRKITASMSLKGTPSSQLVLALTDTYGSSPSSASRILNLSEPLMSKSFDFTNSEHVYLQIGSNVQGYAKKDGILYITNNYNIQIEEGSTATSYVDHLYSQIQAKLPEGEFIGYINATNRDRLSTKYNSNAGAYQLVLNKCIAKITIDGTKGSFSTTSVGRFNIDNIISNYLKTSQSYGITMKCDNYISFPQTLSNSDFDKLTSGYNYGIGLGGGTANNIRIKNVNFSNVEDFKNDLKQHPITLYYILNIESRRTLDLGAIGMPLSYNEVTNIFTDSDLLPKINAKYYRNFITTVQNLQVNEKALKQELADINTRLSALESASTNVVSESEVTE